jgi:hypothetical protein
MNFILNSHPEIEISSWKISYFHMNVSPGYTDSNNRQDDALATDEFIENYFMRKGKLPKCVIFCAMIRTNHCHDPNEA